MPSSLARCSILQKCDREASDVVVVRRYKFVEVFSHLSVVSFVDPHTVAKNPTILGGKVMHLIFSRFTIYCRGILLRAQV